MKILHTSDWHLGRSLHGHPLNDDQDHALKQILELLRQEPYDALIVAGDIFDKATPSNEAARMLGGWLTDVRKIQPQLPIVMISGNHDNGPRLACMAGLLDHQAVYLRGETGRIDEPIVLRDKTGGEAEIWALPYLLPGALGEALASQSGAMEEALRRIRERQNLGRSQILVAHCFVRGGQGSDSERTLIGTATLIEAELFHGFDYVALGHLHRRQSPAPHVHYSGSIARYSFSEEGYDKVVLSVELDPGAPCRIRSTRLTDLRPMKKWTDSLENLLHSPRYNGQTDDYVELTLAPPCSAGNPMDALRKRWTHLLSFHNSPEIETVSKVEGPSHVAGPRDLVNDFAVFSRMYTGGAELDLDAAFQEVLTASQAQETA